MTAHTGHVIIAGFGIGGRFIAQYLRETGIPFVLVEKNPETCRNQTALGVEVFEGDISDPEVLRRAGVETASVLALSIPDEQAAIEASQAANAIRPEIHIIAATRYTSSGLKALQVGADEVIVAEQAVAHEFHHRIQTYLCNRNGEAAEASTTARNV